MSHHHYLIVPSDIKGEYDDVCAYVMSNSSTIAHYGNGMGNEKRAQDAIKVAAGETGNNFYKAAPFRLAMQSGTQFHAVVSESITEEEAKLREKLFITPVYREAINKTIALRLESLNRTEEDVIASFPVFYGWLASMKAKGDVYTLSYMKYAWSHFPAKDLKFANLFFGFMGKDYIDVEV